MPLRVFVIWLISIASFASAATAFAQSDVSNEELRALLQALDRKLAGEPSPFAQEPQGSRTTEIGNIQAKPAQPKTPAQVVRVYDLSDLFAVAPPYPAFKRSDLSTQASPLFPMVGSESSAGVGFGGGMGGMGGGFGGGGLFAVEDGMDASQFIVPSRGNLGAARVSLDELVNAITSTIQPEDWEERGGESTISNLGNALLISAPPETHAQIDNLLKLLRDRWGSLRTISVRAYWLWLDDAQLDAALSAETPEPPMGFGILSDDAWAQLQQTAAGEDVLPGYRAAITFYNGQTVHTMSGGQQLTVRGITPVVGSDTEVGYSPETAVIQTGATLQVTGMATRRAEFVVLDLHSRVCTATRLDENNENMVVPTPAVATTDALDRYQISLQRLSTTTRVPVDRTMLVGGMSFDEQPAPGSPSLYLFVRTSVQELRDDREDDK